jgi:hypothetical protein
MKITASILFLYLLGLFIQPSLFPLPDKEKKAMACCSKDKTKTHKNCPNSSDGCCDNNQCNPFFSQCPLCIANATTVKKYMLPQPKPDFFARPEFFSKNSSLISHYQADILRPPQQV